MNDEAVITTCDVCDLVDNDQRQKVCQWCGRCQAWICENCRPSTLRRGRAMAKRGILKFLGLYHVQGY